MERQRHSPAGIASFIVSSVSTSLIVAVLAAAMLHKHIPIELHDGVRAAGVVTVCLIFLAAISSMALALGIIGLFQKARKRIFAVLGTAISAMTVVVMILIPFIFTLLID